jgi:hypothetical protein
LSPIQPQLILSLHEKIIFYLVFGKKYSFGVIFYPAIFCKLIYDSRVGVASVNDFIAEMLWLFYNLVIAKTI